MNPHSEAPAPFRLEISAHRLIRLLAWTVVALVAAHLVLQILHYRVHPVPDALKRLFDLDEETNAPSWYSWTALLLASGLLFVVAAARRARRDRDAFFWSVLAWGFLFMSLDEDASIHESLNAIENESGHTSFSWTYPALVLVLALAVMGARFVWRLPRRFRWWFLISAFLYLSGAVGMEMVGHAWLRANEQNTQDSLAYNLIAAVEETLEMGSIVMFLGVLLRYARSELVPADGAADSNARPTVIEFRFPGRRVVTALSAVAVVLVAAHLVIRYVHYRVHPVPWIASDMLNLGEENNIPAWFAAALMLFAGTLLAAIAVTRRRAGARDARGWFALSIALVVLSLAKDAALPDVFESLVHLNWSIPAAVVALGAGVALARYASGLPKRVRDGMNLAGALYVAGALGAEWVALCYLGLFHGAADSLGYGLIVALKQSLEMAGMLMLIGTLLGMMREETGSTDGVPMALEIAA